MSWFQWPMHQRVVAHVDPTVPRALLVVAADDGAERAAHLISAAELVAVGEQVAVVVDPIEAIRAVGDGELHPSVARGTPAARGGRSNHLSRSFVSSASSLSVTRASAAWISPSLR